MNRIAGVTGVHSGEESQTHISSPTRTPSSVSDSGHMRLIRLGPVPHRTLKA